MGQRALVLRSQLGPTSQKKKQKKTTQMMVVAQQPNESGSTALQWRRAV